MSTNDDIIKLSLTEILTRQYTSTLTFLFDNESPPSIAIQASEKKQKTISNDIKSLNCTKLSLQIVKALNNIEASANDHTNQLSTNDFQINIKLSDTHLILLDVSYSPEKTVLDKGSVANIQSIGHLLHTVFTSADANNQQQMQLSQRSSVVSEDTTSSSDGNTEQQIVDGNSNSKGGKELRIAKVRRSQIDTLFATLGKISVVQMLYDVSFCMCVCTILVVCLPMM